MPFDPFEQNEHLNEDIGMFEAAAHAQPVEFKLPDLDAIHLASDGSNQDATARGLATALAKSSGAQLHEHAGADTARDILEKTRQLNAKLLVLPTPFGRDFDVLRDESLGSVVDILLLEAPCPVLCVRGLMDEDAIRAALADVFVPLAANNELAWRAVSWALRVVAKGGQLDLRAIADSDVIEQFRRLAIVPASDPTLQPDLILRAVFDEMGGIVAAAQKHGVQEDLQVHVENKIGALARSICDEANQRPCLIVWGAVKDHNAPTFHQAVDLILAAHGPVLIA